MMKLSKDVPSTTDGSPDTGRSRSGKLFEWVSKCGEPQRTKRMVHAHQKQCPICLSMIHTGPTSGKPRTMYCGAVVCTRKKISEHLQTCPQCQQARKQIRIDTCKNLQHTPEMRSRYSETAKKTAARSDIQQERAARLKNWRDNNREKFWEIHAKALTASKRSKMEIWLEPHLVELGFIRNTKFRCGDQKKQVDFIHKPWKTIIEVDGPWHFLPVRSPQNLVDVQQRDRMLEKEILKRSWRLIRLSMECFRSYSGELISPSLDQLFEKIKDTSWVGILCYGNLYESLSWDGVKVTILK